MKSALSPSVNVFPGQRLSEKLNVALKNYKKGKYNAVLSICKTIYSEDACCVDNLLMLGAIYFLRRDISESLFYNQQCLKVDPDCVEALSNIGNCFQELGDKPSAIQFFMKAIKLQPRFSYAYSNLALVYFHQGDIEEAINSLNTAIALDPQHADALSNLGNLFKTIGFAKYDDAKKCYLDAVKANPRMSIAWSNLAGIFSDWKEFGHAIESYQQATTLSPTFADAYSNLGNTWVNKAICDRDNKELMDKARSCYEKALSLRPNFDIANGNLGVWFMHNHSNRSRSDWSNVIKYLQRSVQSHHVSADPLNNLGNVYMQDMAEGEARKCYVRALKICPSHGYALTNLGVALVHKGMMREAICSFRASADLCPTFVAALNNLGMAMIQFGHLSMAKDFYADMVKAQLTLPFEIYLNHGVAHAISPKAQVEAVEYFRLALRAHPNSVKSIDNIATIYMDAGRFDECILCCKRALEIRPNYIPTQSKLMFASASICNFESSRAVKEAIADLLLDECGRKNLLLHPLMAQMISGLDESNILEIAKANAARLSGAAGSLFTIFPLDKVQLPRGDGRIKIGYLSSNFGNTDVGHLIGGIFRLHNRESFEVFCYSLSRDDFSPWFKAVNIDADHFRDFSSTENIDAAVRIHQDEIDILIDLDGYTSASRPEILSFQPAPLQVNYLGHFGTSGASYIQYVVVDETIASEAYMKVNFTEKAIFMPSCAIVNDHMNYPTAALEDGNLNEILDRAMFGISDDVFLYACFHPLHCITEIMFNAWIKILKRTDGSVLWITKSNSSAEKNLKIKARSFGVDAERIVFSEPAPYNDNLKRYDLVDIVLGGLEGLGGITVGVDAIWSGTPMITLIGKQLFNRVEASCLRNAGLGDLLITSSIDKYIDLAVQLNFNEFQYMELRKKLESIHVRSHSELFDTCKWVRCFESGLSNAYDSFQVGNPRKNIFCMTGTNCRNNSATSS